MDGRAGRGFVALADIAKSGNRRCRTQTKQDEPPAPRGRQSRGDRGAECRVIADPMIDRHRQNHRVGILLAGEKCRNRDGRRGVSPKGLEHDGRVRYSHRAQLLADDKAMFRIRNHHGIGEQQGIADPQRSLLQQRLFAEQRKQLLRIGFAGQRPEPRSCAARQQNGNYASARVHHLAPVHG